jgi:hypothetical protein
MQVHPHAGHWWGGYFDTNCAAPIRIIPYFTEPTMHQGDDIVTQGPIYSIRQVDDTMVSAAATSERKAILDGIASTVTFKTSPTPTTSFYAKCWNGDSIL